MDAAVGYALLGLGIVFVLGLVFALTSRLGGGGERATPPAGVHLPPPSYLPAIMALGAGLIAAGAAFKPDDMVVNFYVAVPGLVILVLGIFGWVRAANREWTDTERGPHDDHATH